jgi:hypothetical protein
MSKLLIKNKSYLFDGVVDVLVLFIWENFEFKNEKYDKIKYPELQPKLCKINLSQILIYIAHKLKFSN